MTPVRRGLYVSWAATALLIGGCGGAGSAARRDTAAGTALRQEVQVIRGWASALRRGDVDAAASYFALPSLFANGPGANGATEVFRIRDPAAAREINASLPCGARLVSARTRGRYVDAIFTLTGRSGPGGTDCEPGVGASAETYFLIAHGKIVDWFRAPTPATPGSPPNTTPTTPTSPAVPQLSD
jgi:hypothetical protein